MLALLFNKLAKLGIALLALCEFDFEPLQIHVHFLLLLFGLSDFPSPRDNCTLHTKSLLSKAFV